MSARISPRTDGDVLPQLLSDQGERNTPLHFAAHFDDITAANLLIQAAGDAWPHVSLAVRVSAQRIARPAAVRRLNRPQAAVWVVLNKGTAPPLLPAAAAQRLRAGPGGPRGPADAGAAARARGARAGGDQADC